MLNRYCKSYGSAGLKQVWNFKWLASACSTSNLAGSWINLVDFDKDLTIELAKVLSV